VEERQVDEYGMALAPECPTYGATTRVWFVSGTAPMAGCSGGVSPWGPYGTEYSDTMGTDPYADTLTTTSADDDGWWRRLRRRIFGNEADTTTIPSPGADTTAQGRRRPAEPYPVNPVDTLPVAPDPADTLRPSKPVRVLGRPVRTPRADSLRALRPRRDSIRPDTMRPDTSSTGLRM
jgi:hypothetical protein